MKCFQVFILLTSLLNFVIFTGGINDAGTAENISKVKAALAEKRSLLALELKYIEQLALRNKLAKERLALAEQWRNELRETYQSQQEKAQQQTLEELEKQLATERQKWQGAVATLREQLAQLRVTPYGSQAKQKLTEIQLLSSVIFHVRVPVPVLLIVNVLIVSVLPKSKLVGVTDKTATLIVNWNILDHSPQLASASFPRTRQK